MIRKSRRIAAEILPALLLLLTTVATAAEGGNAAEESTGVTFKWIHFVIIAMLAYWVFGKLLPPVFKKKADMISDAITKATAAKAEAERQLQEAEAKLATLEREVAAFRAMAQKDASAEVERLRNATKTDMEKIVAAGKAEIAAAERAARLELKELAAKLSVDKAESLVAQQMTPAVQDALINNFVQSLQGRPN
jgi:F0F1-type ATP synthase membrane subunit b/b'